MGTHQRCRSSSRSKHENTIRFESDTGQFTAQAVCSFHLGLQLVYFGGTRDTAAWGFGSVGAPLRVDNVIKEIGAFVIY
jgi:hypothetical protein